MVGEAGKALRTPVSRASGALGLLGLPAMSGSEAKHVFTSYVVEDTARIDTLCRIFTAAGIPYWRNRTDLGPGDEW